MKEVNLLGQVNMPAQRIVSLLPSLTETIFLMGLGSKVVGVTEQCNYPEEAREREKVGFFVHADTVESLYPSTPKVGMPVGFVKARESKEELMKWDVPWITVAGRRGGSAMAVATVNASLKLVQRGKK